MMSHGNITQYIDKIMGDQFGDTTDNIALAISGGPDSMCLLHGIQTRWQGQGKNLSHLHILTCDHNTRENIQKEIDLVQHASHGSEFVCFRYGGSYSNEEALRQRRHREFIDYCHKNSIRYLFTGHHLNDRIETSLLNMKRGTGLKGISNITVSDHHFLDNNITIFRPLITNTKQEIVEYCKYYSISYGIDPTNSDKDCSERNTIRNIIQEQLGTQQFYESRQLIYDNISQETKKIETIDNNTIKQKDYDLIKTTSGQRTPDLLYNLYKNYNISINPRSTTLETLCKQLNKQSGNKISYQGLTINAYQYGSTIKKILQ